MLIPLIARYWPFANGSGRLIDNFAGGVKLGSGQRTVVTSSGFPITVLADDLIGRHIVLTGRFDHSVVRVLLDHAQPGDVLLDIGANIGYVAACFLHTVPNGMAICVEPQPEIVDLLRRNLEQFGRNSIRQVALSDRDGEAGFHVNTVNRGNSGIRGDGEVKVPITKAAKLLSAIQKLDLIKIDVEGHELPIFRSMEHELRRLGPRAILFEDQTNCAEIRDILSRCGYRIFAIKKTLLRTRLIENGEGTNDYIALKE